MTKLNQHKMYTNPILPGFYPDPSVCQAGEHFYLVTSSFAYYPGIPIFESTDLVNWRQIGHVLDRPSQLNLDGLKLSEGIFAPTIRYDQGVFYVITTNVGGGGNFIVTATDPAGTWSDPYWLPEAPGIDPSLFFDDQGRTYYVGTRPNPAGPAYDGDWEIWLQELDLSKMQLIGEQYSLWKGALREAIWPEGPHLYKHNGYYYLLIAEGGTGHHHAVSIARSKDVTGPYVGNPANPILTHRHLGVDYPIVNVGHGDLIQTPSNQWWLVVLASRPYGGYYRNLGRETFLTPVRWEGEWPVVSPGTGKVEFSYPVPDLPESNGLPLLTCDHFDEPVLDLRWDCLRTPREQWWSLTDRPGYLRLFLRPETISKRENPSFIGRRQQHQSFLAQTVLEFVPEKEHEEAGLVCFQNDQNHYRLVRTKHDSCQVIKLFKCEGGSESTLAEVGVTAPRIYLQVIGRGQDYHFYYGEHSNDLQLLHGPVDGRLLSTDRAGGFVGAYIGLYASSNGASSNNHADFDWFEYQVLPTCRQII
jgi:alpha-N-arabinofuranosidase